MMRTLRKNSDGTKLVRVTGTYKLEKRSEGPFNSLIDEISIVDEGQKPIYIAPLPDMKILKEPLDGRPADFDADAYTTNDGTTIIIPRGLRLL